MASRNRKGFARGAGIYGQRGFCKAHDRSYPLNVNVQGMPMAGACPKCHPGHMERLEAARTAQLAGRQS